MQYERFFLFLIPFLILEILKNSFSVELLYHKDSSMFRPLNKVKPCSVSSWMGDQMRKPCVIIQLIVTLSKYGHDALDICHP